MQYKKQTLFVVIIIAAYMSLVASMLFVVQTADTNRHWDGINYYYGYLAINGSIANIFDSYEWFGRPPEIILNLIYLAVYPLNIIKKAEHIVILNGIIFLTLFNLSVGLYCYTLSKKKILNSTAAVILFASLHMVLFPGTAMQLGRQSLIIPTLFFVILLTLFFRIRNKYIGYFISVASATFVHAASVFTAMFMYLLNGKRKYQNKGSRTIYGVYLLIVGGSLYITNFQNELLFGIQNPEFKPQTVHPFSNLTADITILTMILVYLLFLKKNKKVLGVILIYLIYVLSPSFLISRLVYGIDYVIPILSIFMVSREAYYIENPDGQLAGIALFIMLILKSLYISFIAIS